MAQIGSYLICATPRTGSTLLCSLLQSTGVAGHPESYFREPDEAKWAAQWGLSRSTDGIFNYADFVRAARAAGCTGNGLFAARIMWGSMDELVDGLGKLHPDSVGANIDLLGKAFGCPRFVYLSRDDVLAQAVSWFRAEQTDVWHRTEQSRLEEQEQNARFNFDRIHELVQVIHRDNEAWREWFAATGVAPFHVRYEDLDMDPVGTTLDIVEFLELELPPNRRIGASNVRMADEVSAQWIDLYRAMTTQR